MSHLAVLAATDFFTAEVLKLRGILTYCVLFFIEIGSRRVHLAGITPHLNEAWMMQIGRDVTKKVYGFLDGKRYLLLVRDSKFSVAFRATVNSAGVQAVRCPIAGNTGPAMFGHIGPPPLDLLRFPLVMKGRWVARLADQGVHAFQRLFAIGLPTGNLP